MPSSSAARSSSSASARTTTAPPATAMTPTTIVSTAKMNAHGEPIRSATWLENFRNHSPIVRLLAIAIPLLE